MAAARIGVMIPSADTDSAQTRRRRPEDPSITEVSAKSFTVPAEAHESDGTLEWDSTTIIVVHISTIDTVGLGYTYTHSCARNLINGPIADALRGESTMSPPSLWRTMELALRNVPFRGLAVYAASAVDAALWDLKARLLSVPLVDLLGRAREEIPIYASGGFTSYSTDRVCEQLGSWAADGIPQVKMKVGREPSRDARRVRAARGAIGANTQLFVDANGAYTVEEAVTLARRFEEHGVSWFEEPRPSYDLDGLAAVKARTPESMEIAAGEYGESEREFTRMLNDHAVDIVQPDITRCGGFTGISQIAAACEAYEAPISLHCAPSLSAHAACAHASIRHIEWFFDHVRIENLLFDGVPTQSRGRLIPNADHPGHGLVLKAADAARFEDKV